jgi:hypothetical protein
MGSAAWFVLFPAQRLPDDDAVTRKLRGIRGCHIKHGAKRKWAVVCGTATIAVGVNLRPYVIVETREAVQRHGDELPNPAEVAAMDARFELLYDEGDIGNIFNPLLATAERLAELTSGVVYESSNGAFQIG